MMRERSARPFARSILAGAVVWTACFVLFFASSVRAEDQDASARQRFVTALQTAIRIDDKNWLAANMAYPVRFFGKRKTTIPSRAAFLARYASFVGPKLKAAVLAQNPGDVFENWQGAMVGDGTYNIWITQVGRRRQRALPDHHHQ